MAKFFSFISFSSTFLCFLTSATAQISNVTALGSVTDSELCGSLKVNNEILKLRLDVLELKQNFSELTKKLQNVEHHQLELGNPVALSNVLNHFEGKEPKLCIQSGYQGLACSDIVLPNSCANSNVINCWNNKCRIQNRLYGTESFLISCEHALGESGWTTIQRRVNGSVDFHHLWSQYKHGFGDMDGNYWMGLKKLHSLTMTWSPAELLVILIDFNNVMKYARYDNFAIGDEASNYALKELGTYSGTAGDSLSSHKGLGFSAIDNDNDNVPRNCATGLRGGWWYNHCFSCNLNGRYFADGTQPKIGAHDGIIWSTFHGEDYSLKFVQMLIKPKKV